MDLDAILDSDFDVGSQFSDVNPEHDLEPALDHLQAAIFAQFDDFESSQEVDLHDEDEPWDIDDSEVMDFFDPQSPLSSIGRNDSDSESAMFMDDRAGEYYSDDGDVEENEGDDDEIVVIAENPHPIVLPRAPERDREERARHREARQRDYNGDGGQRERRRSASPAARRYVPDRHRPGVDELIDLDFFPPRRHQPRNLHQQPRQQPHLVMNAAVIDLTDEPDSPPAHRNPRRQMSNSQRNPPALARSDGSLLGARTPRSQPPGGRAPFIDLTLEESPEHAAQNQDDAMDLNDDEVLFVRNSRRPDSVMPLGFEIAHFADLANGLAHGMLQRLVGHRFRHHVIQQQPDPNPLRANMPDLNYVRAVRSDKPAYEEPAAAPEGFTRETGQLAEDEILVCPSCDAELAYDPDSEDEPTTPNKSSGKGTRGKKTKEQRFWLVKECGHVYCRKCFNNRRPTHKLWSTTTWRLDDGTCADGTRWTNTPQQPQNQGRRRAIPTLCAVEDCRANVTDQKSWVGIFM